MAANSRPSSRAVAYTDAVAGMLFLTGLRVSYLTTARTVLGGTFFVAHVQAAGDMCRDDLTRTINGMGGVVLRAQYDFVKAHYIVSFRMTP
jgi:hypothetical protein